MTAPRFERTPAATGPCVRGFAGKLLRIGDERYAGVLLTPERVLPWSPPPLDALGAADVAPLLALAPPPEFLLLGTGPATVFPPRALVLALEVRGIGVEAMDSRAAARAWGLLRGEGRWIAAALMPL
ncbi:MAG: hypothetical protein KF780_05360 [Sphingomonas sp.]|nr:hypothetical protein [Sphingomonas sp.]